MCVCTVWLPKLVLGTDTLNYVCMTESSMHDVSTDILFQTNKTWNTTVSSY